MRQGAGATGRWRDAVDHAAIVDEYLRRYQAETPGALRTS